MSLVNKREDGFDIYQVVTDRVIELLEKGTVPWHKPWVGGESNWPTNYVSKKKYRGINVWLLSSYGYESPYWLSFKQATDLGGTIRKGEKSAMVTFWKRIAVYEKDADGRKQRKFIPLLRYYRVFNIEQTEGIEFPKPEPRTPDFDPIVEAEKIVEGMPNRPPIQIGGGVAAYQPTLDIVKMPDRERFDGEQQYYAALFHELVHSTGHKSRLAREGSNGNGFGGTGYAKEELVAEMGAAFLSAQAGILDRVVDNSAAYIQNWLGALRNDRKLVVQAAGAAQRASDYIRDVKFENGEGENGHGETKTLQSAETVAL